MIKQKLEIIDKHLRKRNFGNAYAFALDYLVEDNKKLIQESEIAIQLMEQKYGMSFEEFEKQYPDKEEKDRNYWKSELEKKRTAENDLIELENLLDIHSGLI